MSIENAQTVLAELGIQMGIDQLAFNDEGLCSIGLDDFILNMELTANGDTLILTAWIATISEDRRSEAALRIADANYLFFGTQGATLGMNRSTGDVVLAVQLTTATLTLASLDQVAENFMNVAEVWQHRLVNEDTAPEPPRFDSSFGLRV
ncbi:MAG: type III secretion system chaperone [Candidatus Competibacteraceae bacterium]|nr:type III secretion system chaperone [Candidatus Competibacteraceae bacterium]MCB1815234.1 type III secretion system chaperone [Candidatus Competibacteraceae bacterium]